MTWTRLMKIDERIIYIVATIAVIFPMFVPIGFPVSKDAEAVAMYELLSSLPAGTNIIYSFDCEAVATTEIKPSVEVLFDLSYKLNHNIFMMSFNVQGMPLARVWTDPVFARNGAVYGEDWIDLGYIEAANSFLEIGRSDLLSAWNNQDYTGKPLTSFPIMANVKKASDINLVVSFHSNVPGWSNYVNSWYATDEVKMVATVVSAINTPGALSSYNSGLLKGLVNGLNGAATLEAMHGAPGSAHSNSDAQSIAHLAIIGFVIIGNIAYFGAKKAGEL